MMKTLIILLSVLFIFTSCNLDLSTKKGGRKKTYFIGIDVSGSFSKSKQFKNSLKFLGHYIHAHLKGSNGLNKPKALYVGGIGGDQSDEPQAFFPIHDFEDMSPKQIQKKLAKEFAYQKDNLTDFNVFFDRVATICKQKNLTLAPIQIIMISDGVPEVLKGKKKSKKVKYQAYSRIKVKPLEYLSRNVSLRLLYTSPKVGNEWLKHVPKRRVKVMSVEAKVMYGWEKQLKRGKDKLHKWMSDIVDSKISRMH